MDARFYLAQTAARLWLLKLWERRKELFPEVTSPRDIIIAAPEVIACKLLNINVLKRPAIIGGQGIAGSIDRQAHQIEIATSFSISSQRFTFAHEIGHWILHPGNDYFRDRSISAPGSRERRPPYEVEADVFAAELLMPKKHLTAVFDELFGGPIVGTFPDQALADAVSKGKRLTWTPSELAAAEPIERARAVATSTFYRGRHFTPLIEYFEVSQTAMAIQLLDQGLVS